MHATSAIFYYQAKVFLINHLACLMACLGIMLSLPCYGENINIDTVNDPVIDEKTIVIPITLRAGDSLKLDLSGEDDLSKTFDINRHGYILLPEVGMVKLSGFSLPQAKNQLKLVLSKNYLNVDKLKVILLDRRLLLTILGYVKRPGPVTIPQNGNVQMALIAAGGLSSGAQLDKLQIRRHNKVIIFDYKKYLDNGDILLLPQLKSLDVLFVPVSPLVGNVQMQFDAASLSKSGDASDTRTSIKVFGEVNRPGSFSYKPDNSIVDVLMRAGGVSRYAGVENIRVINKNTPELFDLKAYLDTGNVALLPKLSAGATIFVPKESKGVNTGARTVYLMGEVFKPGAYEISEGTGFFDMIANAGGPSRYANSRQLRIIRADGSVESFDLQSYLEGGDITSLPTIKPGDAIFIPEKTDTGGDSWLKISPSRAVRVMGAVKNPGRFEWADEMSLLDLLAHAGGPNNSADIKNIKVIDDQNSKNMKIFNLYKFLHEGGDFADLPIITAGCTVFVPELANKFSNNKSRWLGQDKDKSIYVFGEVGVPGRYAFNHEMGFLDILSAANGPNSNADIHNIHITHRNKNKANAVTFDLSEYFLTGDETLLPTINIGDTIYVPERNKPWLDESKENTVRVLGAVAKPGRYHFNDNMTILDLLAEAGGPTQEAYIDKIIILNVSKSRSGQDIGRSFDLEDFVKYPDFSNLPLVRAGDTVYIPSIEASNWRIFMSAIRDMLQIVSVWVIVGAL